MSLIDTLKVRMPDVFRMRIGHCALLALALGAAGNAQAQHTAVVGAIPPETSTDLIGPYYSNGGTFAGFYTTTQAAMLYTQEELQLPYGAVIREVAWLKNKGKVDGDNVFKIWMGKAGHEVQYFRESDSKKWGILKELFHAQHVYEDSARQMNAADSSWESFTLQTPYVYTGGGLMIGAHWVRVGSANGVTSTFYGDKISRQRLLMAGATSTLNDSTVLSILPYADQDRAVMRLTYDMPVHTDDAGISEIAVPGTLCEGVHPVRIKLRNNGMNRLDSVRLNWEVNGVVQPEIYHTTPVDVYGSSNGNEAEVVLGNLYVSDTLKKVKVWTSYPNGKVDTINVNDTLSSDIRAALNGVYTIGGSAPDFAYLSEAAGVLSRFGVCGPVEIRIRPGNYVEPKRITFENVQGVSSLNNIVIRSENGDRTSVIITSHDTVATLENEVVYLIALSGTSHVSLKDFTMESASHGLNNYNKLLLRTSYRTMGHPDNADSFYVVPSDTLVVDNCVFRSPATLLATQMNLLDFGIANKYALVQNNLFERGGRSVVINGGNYVVFRNNVLRDSRGDRSALVGAGDSLWVTDNVIEKSTVGESGIRAFGTRFMEVTGNRISIQSPASTKEIKALDISRAGALPLEPAIVANNVVYAENAGNCYGIYSNNSRYVHFYNNSVYINSTGSTGFAGYFRQAAVEQKAVLINNVFSKGRANSLGAVLYIEDTTHVHSDHNNIHAPSGRLVTRNKPSAAHYSTLAAWRAVSGRNDVRSISYPPGFLAGGDLVPNPADSASWSLNGRGMHLVVVTRDINGVERPLSVSQGAPDIGAYEFTPVAVPPRAVAAPALPVANSAQTFMFGGNEVAVLNWGASVPASEVAVRQYSGETAPDLGKGNLPKYMYFHTDIEGPAGAYAYEAKLRYMQTWTGTVPEEDRLHAASRTGGTWSFLTGTASSADTLQNIITIPSLSGFALFTATDMAGTIVCAGQPQQMTIANAAAGLCSGEAVRLNGSNPNQNGGGTVTGYTFRWEEAPDAAGPWAPVTAGLGGSAIDYTTPSLTGTTWYRVNISCAGSGQSAAGAPFEVQVAEPGQVLTTTPGTHCGPGAIVLGAGARPVDTLLWYTSRTGGSALATGPSYTTAVLNETAIYYVSASANGVCESERQAVAATIYRLPLAPVSASGDISVNPMGDILFCEGGSVAFETPDVAGYSYRWQKDGADIVNETNSTYSAGASGKYTVTVTDANGCSRESAAQTVNVHNLPVPEVTLSGNALTAAGVYSFYQWYLNGSPISGANARTYIPATEGAYHVEVTDDNGCSGRSQPYGYSLSVGVFAGSEEVTVYPNPVQNQLRISAPFPVSATLYSVEGRVIRHIENVSMITVADLADGIYSLRLTDASGRLISNVKLVKQMR